MKDKCDNVFQLISIASFILFIIGISLPSSSDSGAPEREQASVEETTEPKVKTLLWEEKSKRSGCINSNRNRKICYTEQKPMDSFAFDFLQNSKYSYRKVENMTSESILSNEEQMDKALVEMGK